MLLYKEIGVEVFRNTRVMEVLKCSESTATSYIKRLSGDLEVITAVEGRGKGKYKF